MIYIVPFPNQSNFEDYKIKDEIVLSDPKVVNSLYHPKKQLILKELIKEEHTIYDLKLILKINPGVIKRHIDDLLDKKLILQTHTAVNKLGLNLKFYRSVAKKFIVHLIWPDFLDSVKNENKIAEE